MNSNLSVNSVLKPVDENVSFQQPCRLLWMDEQMDLVALITIEKEPKKPWLFGLSTLRSLLSEQKAVIVQLKVPEFMMTLEDEIPAKYKDKRDANWERIRPIVQGASPSQMFESDTMGVLVKQHAEAVGVEKKSLYRLLYRYWMFGSIRNALLPNYPNSGGKGVEKNYAPGKSPGRPPKVISTTPRPRAKTLTKQDKIAIRIGYALYCKNEVKSKGDAYTRMLRKFYCESIPTPDFPEQNITLKPLSELPNQIQFEYWGKKSFDDMTVLRGRKGERRWAKDHRPLRGRASDGLFGPGHRFEIDATVADIYLISRFNRNWVIGRPVVYVVVDVFSRMIVGLFVGLEGPSWNGARQALLNTFTDKAQFCADYGIQIRPEDWPCAHLPQELSCDRGEMLGLAAEAIVPSLGIDLVIAPPFRPDWKAVVESRFRILNQLTQIHWIPGGVAQRIKERGERDYREDATLTLREFTEIIIRTVLHYNHHTTHPDSLTPPMVADGISSTGISIWNWGIDHGFATRVEQAPDLVKLQLLNKAAGTIQAGGIHFSGMLFSPEDDRYEKFFARARANGHQPIDVWHDPMKPAYIWIRNTDKSLLRCQWRSPGQYDEAARFEEILDMQQMINYVGPDQLHAQLTSKVNLDARIQAIVDTATAEKREAPKPVSKAAQLANIRSNRAIERAAGTGSPQVSSDVQQQDRDAKPYIAEGYGERSAEVIDILSQLRRKGAK